MSRTKQHSYLLALEWTGNDGVGTAQYHSYRRDHVLRAEGKPAIAGSSDPSFRGDAARWNPEELLVASLCSCHMLWYLHFCATNHIRVIGYTDTPVGEMEEQADGSGAFTRVVLQPSVTLANGKDVTRATEMHYQAHRFCFIANSVKFPIEINASVHSTEA